MIEARFSGAQGAFRLDAEFRVPGAGVTALFGSSGCGKTTVLRCLAGLARFPDGELRVNGESWQEGRRFVPVHRRALGYVFQEASLFAHLSVRENLAYGQRRARATPQQVSFDDVVELLGIAPLFDRPTERLSGGERQRVAIGRALLAQPRLVLMDEPLSALDRISKEEILPYLERLHRNLSIPVVYVSHDIAEVERIADTIVLMEAGRVRAVGPIAEILTDPELPFLHGTDPDAVLDGQVRCFGPHYGLTEVAVPGGLMLVTGNLGAVGARCRLRIAAREVSLARQLPLETSILNALPARVLGAEPVGSLQISVRLALGADGTGARILSRISRLSWDRLQLSPGELVYAQVKAVGGNPPRSNGTAG